MAIRALTKCEVIFYISDDKPSNQVVNIVNSANADENKSLQFSYL